MVLDRLGRADRAGPLIGWLDVNRPSIPGTPGMRDQPGRLSQQLRQQLGDAQFETLRLRGANATLEVVLAEALRELGEPGEPTSVDRQQWRTTELGPSAKLMRVRGASTLGASGVLGRSPTDASVGSMRRSSNRRSTPSENARPRTYARRPRRASSNCRSSRSRTQTLDGRDDHRIGTHGPRTSVTWSSGLAFARRHTTDVGFATRQRRGSTCGDGLLLPMSSTDRQIAGV